MNAFAIVGWSAPTPDIIIYAGYAACVLKVTRSMIIIDITFGRLEIRFGDDLCIELAEELDLIILHCID